MPVSDCLATSRTSISRNLGGLRHHLPWSPHSGGTHGRSHIQLTLRRPITCPGMPTEIHHWFIYALALITS